MNMVYENPKIKSKIDNYDGDSRIKDILKKAYEKEQTEKILSQSEESLINGYSRLIEEYLDNDDLIKICEVND
jgi:hypothetical protein